MTIDEAREAAIIDIAKTIARIAEGDEAGWGIYADIVRVGLSTDYAKLSTQGTKRSVIHDPMAGVPPTRPIGPECDMTDINETETAERTAEIIRESPENFNIYERRLADAVLTLREEIDKLDATIWAWRSKLAQAETTIDQLAKRIADHDPRKEAE